MLAIWKVVPPRRDENQLHAAIVEIIVERSEVKYSTVQNWYPGIKTEWRIYNFVTKRGICRGDNAKLSWTQVETGSVLRGNIRVVFYKVIILSESFILWLLPTIFSKRIPGQK